MNERIVININKDLKKELQIIAIQQDTTVTGIIIPLIEDYVKKHKK